MDKEVVHSVVNFNKVGEFKLEPTTRQEGSPYFRLPSSSTKEVFDDNRYPEIETLLESTMLERSEGERSQARRTREGYS